MSVLIFNQSTKKSLYLNFGLGWDKGHNPAFIQKPYIVTSGASVGSVWTVLYILMSYARWFLNRLNTTEAKNIKLMITTLLVWCSIYPFYTFAIDSAYGGLVSNTGIFILSLLIIKKSWRNIKTLSILILPVLLWITFATTIILSELGYF